MSEEKGSGATKLFLDSLYKNVKMGAESIIDLLPKVKSEQLRTEMTSELEQYEAFAGEICAMLEAEGEKPEGESFISKVGVKMGVMMNTLVDDTESHIAEMMIKGSTMGITDTTKLVRENENTSCSEEALLLARKIIKRQEENIDRLKDFL